MDEQHVARAFLHLRENGISPNKASTKWDIVDPATGEAWPPKAVLRVAHEIAGEVPPSVGGGWPTNDPLKALGFDIRLKPHLESATSSEEGDDIEDILNSTDRSATEKKRLINARLGQGGFRRALEEIWNDRCALTGCDIPEVLRASHIVPWRLSNDKQRLDCYNGLLLVANADALFDRGIISFAESGDLLSSNDIDLEKLGISAKSGITMSKETSVYMKFHRENVFDR